MRQLNNYGLVLVLLLMGAGEVLNAQNASLTGKVHDENEEAMPFAHVLLLQERDSVLVKGVTTDTEGRFAVEGLAVGNYLLNISLLGYEPYYRSIALTDLKEHSTENIQLSPMSQQLQGVQVVGRKALFQQMSDRLILNVGSLPTFSGNNALQVLQKAPGVMVQENSNSISLNMMLIMPPVLSTLS